MPHKHKVRRLRSAAVALCATSLFACSGQQPQENGTDNHAIDSPPPQRMQIVEPPFNRSRLLLAVARAASAHSAGMTDPAVQQPLDGKQFEIRLRFGCEGPGPASGGYGWSLDPDGRTLRLRAAPTLSLEDEVVKGLAGEKVEAVEGFWLPRPWLLQAACPDGQPTDADAAAPPADPEEKEEEEAKADSQVGPAVQRIGIAQFFTAEDGRTRRRMNRPFEAVKQLEVGEQVGQDGFNLVLAGRLRARGDGRVISCAGAGRNRPPDCIVSATVDRVWVERPDDKMVVAEWSM